ncbi:MAG: DivIVA domain-containing protein [Acidimicrobiales bacterium]
MELTPQTLHAVEFREARHGGYNTRDVDDFLERVAAGLGQLHERLGEVGARAEAAEARLLDAQRQLEEVQRRAPSAAPKAAPTAQVAGVNETDDTLRRTLVLAQRTADATIKEAKQEANRLLDEARAEATRTRVAAEDEARRGADHARISVEAELDSLVDQREALRADLDVLNRHIDDQRERIRAGIAELRRIVDDDARLTPGPVPAFGNVDRPAAPPLPSRAAFGSRPAATPPSPLPPDATDDPASPFAAGTSGAHVAALQEPPASDNGPWNQPMPFMEPGDAHRLSGGGSGERGPWLPSELRTSVGDEPPEPTAPSTPADPAGDPLAGGDPGANGTDASAEPETRPSEWGRAVFDPEPTDRPES